MIRPEQLAGALERLDPRDRELLLLSLHRRVPDEDLARLYDWAPPEVARRRAQAIDRLANDLGVKRGEDLGAVLQALLDPETWRGPEPPAPGAEFEAPEGEPRVYRLPTGADTPSTTPTAPEPPARSGAEPSAASVATRPTPVPADASPTAPPADTNSTPSHADATPATPPADTKSIPSPADATPATPPASQEHAAGAAAARPEPVLEMLGADRPAPVEPEERSRLRTLALAGLGIAAFAALAGFVGAREFGGDSGGGTQGSGDDGVRHFVPQERGPLGVAPFPSEEQETSCYPTAYIRSRTMLHREPGGAKLLTIAPRTEWQSPRVLGVSSQREGWLAVTVPELPNGRVGWMRRSAARIDCVRWSLHADLSKRLLYVRRDGHTVRKLAVAIGSPEHPTPQGRFAVTDKLKVSDPRSPYGCCVLALSGHQTKLPDDWPGGDRLAVHATTDASSIGKPVSLGCMRTTSAKARWLIETIPLGAPIFIRA